MKNLRKINRAERQGIGGSPNSYGAVTRTISVAIDLTPCAG